MDDDQDMTFTDFQVLVASVLNLQPEQITPESYFITDLGVDSLRMAELLVFFESKGIEISPDLAWQIRTVTDAWVYCQAHNLDLGLGKTS